MFLIKTAVRKLRIKIAAWMPKTLMMTSHFRDINFNLINKEKNHAHTY